jgi:FtsH-binding integral membrane protein
VTTGWLHLPRLPAPALLLRVIRSSVVMWLLARAAMAGVLFLGVLPSADALQSALHPTLTARILLVGFTALLVHLDRKLAHEHLLQANFGIPAASFVATSLLAAGLADLTVQALLHGF